MLRRAFSYTVLQAHLYSFEGDKKGRPASMRCRPSMPQLGLARHSLSETGNEAMTKKYFRAVALHAQFLDEALGLINTIRGCLYGLSPSCLIPRVARIAIPGQEVGGGGKL